MRSFTFDPLSLLKKKSSKLKPPWRKKKKPTRPTTRSTSRLQEPDGSEDNKPCPEAWAAWAADRSAAREPPGEDLAKAEARRRFFGEKKRNPPGLLVGC